MSTALVASLNLLLGVVYFQYGTMTLVDMARHRRRMGFSHFGAAWVAMAFTCGPHHFAHGAHVAAEGWSGGWLDVAAVAVGLPAGIIWFLLRVEAFRGGSGDRFVAGTPWWLAAAPFAGGLYAGVLVTVALEVPGAEAGRLVWAAPGFLLVVVYLTVGYYLLRTQLANRGPLGGWSLSGLALTVIFPTCAAMHGVHALYTLSGRYPLDTHIAVIDWIAVPAGIYFVWVVQALYRGTFRDWNQTERVAPEAPSVMDRPGATAVPAGVA